MPDAAGKEYGKLPSMTRKWYPTEREEEMVSDNDVLGFCIILGVIAFFIAMVLYIFNLYLYIEKEKLNWHQIPWQVLAMVFCRSIFIGAFTFEIVLIYFLYI
ncbi:hypothetical protein SAMN05660368_02292 [Marvinbryantia formatexigens]|nr:hypothetical protein SAMN05660368_02292 [Marvinbryantia formatexigens]